MKYNYLLLDREPTKDEIFSLKEMLFLNANECGAMEPICWKSEDKIGWIEKGTIPDTFPFLKDLQII